MSILAGDLPRQEKYNLYKQFKEVILLLKQKMAQGAVKGLFVLDNSPASVETIGYAGFDFVVIDTEHGPNDIAAVEHMVRAAEIGGLASIVRVTKNDPANILRALDVGAEGILVPQVNSGQAAREAVQAAKYGPEGQRGLAGIVRAARYGFRPLGEYLAESNKRTVVLVQVEDVKAVAALDEILAVDGIDGIFVGPADLSQSMGITGQFDKPEFNKVIDDVIARTVAAGKVAGIFCFSAEQAKYWAGKGARFLSIGSDGMLFARAAAALAKEMQEI